MTKSGNVDRAGNSNMQIKFSLDNIGNDQSRDMELCEVTREDSQENCSEESCRASSGNSKKTQPKVKQRMKIS